MCLSANMHTYTYVPFQGAVTLHIAQSRYCRYSLTSYTRTHTRTHTFTQPAKSDFTYTRRAHIHTYIHIYIHLTCGVCTERGISSFLARAAAKRRIHTYILTYIYTYTRRAEFAVNEVYVRFWPGLLRNVVSLPVHAAKGTFSVCKHLTITTVSAPVNICTGIVHKLHWLSVALRGARNHYLESRRRDSTTRDDKTASANSTADTVNSDVSDKNTGQKKQSGPPLDGHASSSRGVSADHRNGQQQPVQKVGVIRSQSLPGHEILSMKTALTMRRTGGAAPLKL
jgi:hypothetical protein